jgi:anti-sigma factor RsiW
MSAGPISDLDLHAYIDGELPPDRAALVAARLEVDPQLAALVDAYRADHALLGRIFDPVLAWDLPTPVRETPGPAPRRHVRSLGLGAAAAAAVILVIGSLTLRNTGKAPDSLVADALTARDGAIVPERELPAPGNDVSATVAQYLGVAVKTPDLAEAGWTLRTIGFYRTGKAERFVQLAYSDAGGRLFTIALQAKPGTQRFEITRQDALWRCVWQNDEIEAVMLGKVSQHEMLQMATMSYTALGL